MPRSTRITLAKLAMRASKKVRHADLDRAYGAHTLGRHDLAEDVARRYIDDGGAAPMARLILAPAEVPIGVITAFLGAPFFALVLRTAKQVGL